MPGKTTLPTRSVTDISALFKVLERRDDITPGDRAILEDGPWRTRDYEVGDEIVAEHSEPKESCVIVAGITGRTVTFADGRRQITALHIPGDFVDLHAFLLHVMDHNVVALAPARMAFIGHDTLRRITDSHQHLFRVLSTVLAVDAAIQRVWIACLGRRSAGAHLAHLICEMFLRMEVVGMTRGRSFEFPVTQSMLADTIGLSIVHLNRTLMELRRADLITWERKVVTITNWDRLARAAEFDGTYLNLRKEPR
ncbi:Crp/Fnr family transcriptional regulator [Mesorhizobium sp. CA13]|uniref:Crp/Fnr family transcriptional regulator n=1 Tax=unclassified Mesorhizobium TaxID=325217 RepID=UPI001CCB03E4|nr:MULTISPECIES: Crp/Fnr family transcriptional regulator [unclassified Mesorhizobium]MBZ9857515.1 Crp/Fnr family transcriptional regulator [Mesorhizobium sp. CA13]MBZ9966720.1 Crp/Fnr family transcriptional regulator [Mesorhizobium sp. BR1-1-2]